GLESPSPPNPLSQPWERGRKCLSQVSETTVSRSTISHLDRAGIAHPTLYQLSIINYQLFPPF
ncbi:hypothetical protein PN462_12170, partial [Spirulina sp. CS-785/01]|uniref:hypothetical protein n=1 Tax=Spirulina sp. CS-785/01 TaxID=3021716 RepID=UPI00232CE9D2